MKKLRDEIRVTYFYTRPLCTRKIKLAIFSLFSKRQKQLRGEIPDVYTYDVIPQPLRVQIVHIWFDALGKDCFEDFCKEFNWSVEHTEV